MNDPAMTPKPQDSPEEQTGVGCVARFVRHLLVWLARCHPKNQTADNIGYPQLWYCWPRWTKRVRWVHCLKTWLCGKTTGHEWSKTEIGYSGCGVDHWCRWCDKMVTMPRCESPLTGEMKDLAPHIKKVFPWWRKDALGWPTETFKGKPVKSAIRILCQNIRKVIFKPKAKGDSQSPAQKI